MEWIIFILMFSIAFLFWELRRTKRGLLLSLKLYEALLWTLYLKSRTKNLKDKLLTYENLNESIEIAQGEKLPKDWSDPDVRDAYVKIFGSEMEESTVTKIIQGHFGNVLQKQEEVKKRKILSREDDLGT